MDIEFMWKNILKTIYRKGHYHKKDGEEIEEVLNISGWIDSPLSEIAPNYGALTKDDYIEYLKKGVFDIEHYNIKGEALADYVFSFNKTKEIYLTGDDAFVYTYPERLRNIHLCNKENMPMFFDQIEIICSRLKEDRGSNRAVATLYSAGLDKDEEHIPCLNWIQALIRDNQLFLSVMFRSNDIYNAFPSNMYFITYIGLYIVDKLKDKYPSLVFYGIYYQCSSAHYYKNELDEEHLKKIIGASK